MLRRLIGEDVELVVVPAASRDAVEADAGRLEQVIMNLVVNARDAMPDGGKLTIETGIVQLDEAYTAKELGVKPGPHVTISITDTGTGMDKETQSHLFEPFFTTKERGHGTGLGLATAYGIIRQSGGAIGMISELGQGTTARIYLPLVELQVKALVEPDAPAAARSGAETILLVEDEARVRKLIVGLLAGRGYKVLEAARGDEAIRLARAHNGTDTPRAGGRGNAGNERTGGDPGKSPGAVRRCACCSISGYTDEAIVHHKDVGETVARRFLP